MDKCERCDREGCIEACEPCDCSWPADYHCAECWDGGPLCKHEQPREAAYRDCGEHRVDWRKRALAAEAALAALRETLAVADAKLSRLSQLADKWDDRGGYAKSVFAKGLRNALAGTVCGGPRPLPAPPEPQAVTEVPNV